MSEGLSKFLEKLFDWLKNVIPTASVVGIAVFNHLKGKIWKAEREKGKVELEVKHYENKEKVDAENNNKSDSDIVRDAISEGNSILDGKDPKDS